MSWLLALLLAGVVGSTPDCTIVEFSKDQCGPCQQLQPALEQLKREGWVVRTVNAELEPLLVRRFAIESVPTIVVLREGREVDRIVGAAPYDKLALRLAKHKSIQADGAGVVPAVLQTPTTQSDRPSPQFNTPVSTPAFSQPTLKSASQPALLAHAPSANQPTAPESGLTVRGQSPGIIAFPMLAAAANVTAVAAGRVQSEMNQFANDSQQAALAVQAASFEQPTTASNVSSVAPSGLAASPLNIQQAIARAQAATVRIRVDEENTTAYGTGTIIDVHDDEALILTCGHLFREMKPHSQLTIDLYAGGRSQPMNLPAQLIDFRADPGAEDVGLISFKLPFEVEPVDLLPKGDVLAVGQTAFSFGCDHGDNPTRRDTQVKSINRYMGAPNVEIAGAPAVGRSGGGLFDNQGRLIGVCNAADKAGDEGIFAAAEIVYKQIDRLGLTHLFDKSKAPAGQVQLASTTTAPNSVTGTFAANATGSSTLGKPAREVPQATPSMATANTGSNQIQWPDQSASAAQLKSQPIANPANTASPKQMICIMRDVNGRDHVVTVDSPPTELVDAIHRQASR